MTSRDTSWRAVVSLVTHCCSFQNPNILQYCSSDSYDQSALQAVQLEDGTTAYIHHTVQMPQSDTILAIQADGTVAGLHTGDAAIDPDTISALEQYAAKVLCKAFSLPIVSSCTAQHTWHHKPIVVNLRLREAWVPGGEDTKLSWHCFTVMSSSGV